MADLELLRREQALLLKQVELLTSVNKDLSRKVEKRKRKGEREGKKKAAKGQPPIKKPRASRKSVKAPSSVGPVKVVSPKTNSYIVVGGSKSAAFKKMLLDAEAVHYHKDAVPTQNVVSVLAQCMKKGWVDWGQYGIPRHVIEAAAAAAGVTLEELYTSSEDEAKPRELEMFAGTFASFWFDMSDPKKYGKDLMSDLAAVQNPLTHFVKNVRLSKFGGHNIKMYLEYEVIMARNEYTTEEGIARGEEERVFTVNSTDTSSGTIQSSHPGIQMVRSTAGVETAISKSLAILVEEFSNLRQKGSGWNWVRSKGMTVKISVAVSGVALKGPSSDKAVERALRILLPPPDTREGETGGNHIGTPGWIATDPIKKEVVFNPHPMTLKKSDQHLCFSWAILRALYPNGVTDETGTIMSGLGRFEDRFIRGGNPDLGGRGSKTLGNVADLSEAISQGKIGHILLPAGVTYPVPLKEEIFEQVELLNNISLSIFRLGLSKKEPEIYPFYASRMPDDGSIGAGRKKVYLGLLQTQAPRYKKSPMPQLKAPEIINHFILILDPFPLINKSPTTRVAVSNEARLNQLRDRVEWSASGQACELKKHKLCDNCLNTFATTEESDQNYKSHRNACMNDKPTMFELPSTPEKSTLTFRNFRYTEVHPFVIYADLEAVTVPKEGEEWKGSTELLNDHQVRDCNSTEECLAHAGRQWVRLLPIP